MTLPTQKRSGRPPVDPHDETVRIGVSLPAKQVDEYARRALADDVSIPEIIRRELNRRSGTGGGEGKK